MIQNASVQDKHNLPRRKRKKATKKSKSREYNQPIKQFRKF